MAALDRFAVPAGRAEIRQQILDGKTPVDVLYNEKRRDQGADRAERDGKILMVKECPISPAASKT